MSFTIINTSVELFTIFGIAKKSIFCAIIFSSRTARWFCLITFICRRGCSSTNTCRFCGSSTCCYIRCFTDCFIRWYSRFFYIRLRCTIVCIFASTSNRPSVITSTLFNIPNCSFSTRKFIFCEPTFFIFNAPIKFLTILRITDESFLFTIIVLLRRVSCASLRWRGSFCSRFRSCVIFWYSTFTDTGKLRCFTGSSFFFIFRT